LIIGNQWGAITYLEDNIISKDTNIDISIITKNINKVYETARSLNQNLNIKNEEQEQDEIGFEEKEAQILEKLQNSNIIENNEESEVLFNTELLEYACVAEAGTEFSQKIIILGVSLTLIIMISSIIVIYATFKMTTFERIRELGMLGSIGADKKKKYSIMRKESVILGTIGITIGTFIGMFVSKIVISILDIFARNMTVVFEQTGMIRLLNRNIEMYMKLPLFILILSIIIMYIVIFISLKLSMIKIHKMTIIEAIKRKEQIKIKGRELISFKTIESIFNQEGLLAYRNISKDKTINKAMVISIATSIILFLTINGYITNQFGKEEEQASYIININDSESNKEQVINFLEENELIKSYYIWRAGGKITLSNELKIMFENNVFSETNNTIYNGKEVAITANMCELSKTNYNEILSNAKVTELKKDEIIITNTIFEKTKYGEKVPITNYKVGDYIDIRFSSGIGIKDKKLKIAGIVDNFNYYIKDFLKVTNKNNLTPRIFLIASEETMKEIERTINIDPFTLEEENIKNSIYLVTDKAFEIDSRIEELKEICGEKRNKYIKLLSIYIK